MRNHSIGRNQALSPFVIQIAKLAAHIKLFEPSSNNTVSLFMTGKDEGLEQLDNRQRTIDRLDVNLWREQDLFYALAKASA